MPYYPFLNEKTGEILDVFHHMNDKEKRYIDENGYEWKRQYIVPLTQVDAVSKIDPHSKKDFMQRADKHCKLGEMMDLSRELSARRAEKDGIDPVKQKFYDKYSKDRHGIKHSQQSREEVKKKLAGKGVDLKFNK